ncbi:ZPR1 zinc-finger domain-containing protein [Pisolithus thermaeus]|nr:ZPR1 zinc-finger domain-containing protein [Pisolithus thermaeus]
MYARNAEQNRILGLLFPEEPLTEQGVPQKRRRRRTVKALRSGAAISEKGKRITLRIEEREDLSRDILKSEACGLTIPEIDLALQPGTLGRRFTTVEDAPEQVYEEMPERTYAAEASSTMVDEDRQKFQDFLKQLKEITNAEKLPFTLIQDAPLANSYLQNLYTPDPGPNMEIVTYERT